MKTIIENQNQTNHKTVAGVIILTVGALLLINQLNLFFIPGWLFSWPMWLIAFGIYTGVKHNFRKPIWVIMIFLGVAFLFTENVADASRVVWPAGIIGAGLWMVLRHHKKADTDYPEKSV
ncbi:MAG: hypothetical protein JWP37_2873 [Mucilaginibacter sp.]|nr:hypothetical protein [Mucilaginibacter sp.]